MFAVQSARTSGPIPLRNSIVRSEMFTPGRDIFISPGQAISRFDQGMLINSGEGQCSKNTVYRVSVSGFNLGFWEKLQIQNY